MCGFFCLKPNFKTCRASNQVQMEQNINNAPLKGVMAASACGQGDFASVMPVRRTCVKAQIDLPLYFLLLVLKKPCISYCCICWRQGHLERRNDGGWREPHGLWMGRCFASGTRLPSVCFDNAVGLAKGRWQASGRRLFGQCTTDTLLH